MEQPPWLHTGWATHQGRRPVNEDAVMVDGPLVAVADGVGGSPRGDLASTQAVDTMRAAVDPPADEPISKLIMSDLNEAVLQADDAVKGLARQWQDLRGTATTMCAALFFTDSSHRARAVVANVGDSRCYLLRDGAVMQLTTDQTLAELLREAGVDEVAERAEHVVTSVLGGKPDSRPTVDLQRLVLMPGDMLVLCTDGVSDVLADDDLIEASRAHAAHPDQLAAALVRAAWEAESTDNLTAAVATVTS